MPSLRILLLEDDARDAELIQGLLEADQFVCDVTWVQTRAEFLTALANNELDLILADYRLPSFDGISALKLASSARPDLPFIFVSGTLGEELAIEALKMGATDYILKTGLSRLAPSVRRALRDSGDRAERRKAEEALRRSEAYLAEAQRLSRTGSFGWNVSSGKVYWSDESYRIFECEPATRPTVEMVIDRTHPDDQMLLRQIVDRAAIDGCDFTAEHRLIMPGGSVKYVRLVARRTAGDDKEGLAFVGAATDITERKRGEQRQAAQYGVSRILAESDSLAAAAPDLLQAISEAMDWDWGALWLVDQRAERLRCDCIWRRSNLDGGDLDAASRKMAWAPGQGRVGQVWQSGQSLWIADVGEDPVFQRAPAATRAGLHTYLACPILFGPEALGVVEFFSCMVRAPDEQDLATLAAIGSQISQFIQRKQAEQAVQASEKRFRALIEHAYDVVLLLSAEATVLYASPSVETVLGYRPEELIGRNGFELIHPDHLRDANTQFTRSTQQPGSVITGERLLLHKDGSLCWVENVFVNLLSEPSVQAVVAHLRDVSERKAAEKALRASEERFRTLMEFSFDVYWETDAQHRFIRQEFSERLSDAPPPGSEIGKTRWEVPHLEPNEEAWRKHRETLDAHLPFRDFEVARPNPDGGKRYVAVSGLPVFDKAGRFIGYRGVGRHITERKRIEEALRQREKELREVVDTIPAMTVMALPDGSTVFASRRWTEYAGLSVEDSLGLAWKAAVHPEDLDRHMRRRRESLASGEPFESEVRLRRAIDGEYRWFLVRWVPLRDEGGDILRWYGILADIEDRKRAEAEARESERRYRETQMQLAHVNRIATTGQLTASIAHEVNQPIAATVANAQAALRWLGGEPPNLDEVRQALRRIARDGDRAGAVVARIRDLIKGAPHRDERVDINAAIREVIELIRNEAMKNGVSAQTELVEGLPPVSGDRVELQQVILNLILNAVEAMSETGEEPRELLITTGKTESGDVLVAVCDSGPGLAPPTLEHLFKAFHTTKPNGLGLGLSICRSIIEGHGGRLWASANAPRGAVFQFTLPAEPDVATRGAISSGV